LRWPLSSAAVPTALPPRFVFSVPVLSGSGVFLTQRVSDPGFIDSGFGSQRFRLNTDPDPDPIRLKGFDDQKLKKKYSW
jgi:hypothetical protein